jgi:glycosyltransferase involved in cell wall biosynthesis/Flp pilus assembly protein TadD
MEDADAARLRERLAIAERELADAAAAVGEFVRGSGELDRMSRAERWFRRRTERQLRDHVVATTALQEEVSRLRDWLNASRQSGAALVASLRDQIAASQSAPAMQESAFAPPLRRLVAGARKRLERQDHGEDLVTLADRANADRQWDRAMRLYRAALDRNPNNPPIWVQFGHSLKETGSLADAEAAYRTALAGDPVCADTHLQLGHLLKLRGRRREAEAAYLRCFVLDPTNTHALPELIGLGWSPAQTEELRGFLSPRAFSPPGSYPLWVLQHGTLDDADRGAIRAHIRALGWSPLISVVVPVFNTEEEYLRRMIESVRQQLYPNWEFCLADDASTKPHIREVLKEFAAVDARIKYIVRETNGHICAATNSALSLATGDFVALVDHDDLLAESALYEIAAELNEYPDADIIYSDSDLINNLGERFNPYFKTDWDPDLVLGHNLVSHLGVYRRALVEQVGGMRVGFEGSQDYDLLLRVAERTSASNIRHIAAILYHWRRAGAVQSFSEQWLDRCLVAARRAIRQHLERTGVDARVEPAPKLPGWNRIVYPLPRQHPFVSVIVPTRDRAELLERCANGVLTRTDYEPLELLIVDNGSIERETEQLFNRLLEDRRLRVLRHPGPFNFAAINNRAVEQARGEVVLLLNNDVDVMSPSWLEEMVSHAQRPEIGAVGAKLFYPDGSIQHGGVVLGIGHGAGHFFIGAADDDRYWGFLALTRRVSAVTAACMAVRRSVYLEVGGLDEVNFPIGLNDVDFCLRLRERDYAVLWTPHAQLRHLESASRGVDTDKAESLARLEGDEERLRERWGELLDNDPFYNPNCALEMGHFGLAFPPRRRKPWLPFMNKRQER